MRIIGGQWGGRRLVAPKGDATRPTTDAHREALFNILMNGMGIEPVSVLDLFAGTGALAWEALSHGAEHAVFVEADPAALKSIESNAATLGVPTSRYAVVRTKQVKDWGRLLVSLPQAPFDLIFCDPPYGKDLVSRAFDALEPHAEKLFKPGAILVAEIGSEDEVPSVPSGWNSFKDRSYGITRLIFYRRGETHSF